MNIRKSFLHNSRWPGAQLHDTLFEGVNASHAQFPGTHIDGLKSQDSSFERADFRAATIRNSEFTSNSNLNHADLSGATIAHTTIDGNSSISSANLREATLNHVTLKNVRSDEASFNNAAIHATEFTNNYSPGASFRKTKITDSRFNHSILDEASFEQADVKNTTIRGGTMVEADWTHSNSDQLTLDDVNAGHSNFDQAKFNRLKLKGHKLSLKDTRFAETHEQLKAKKKAKKPPEAPPADPPKQQNVIRIFSPTDLKLFGLQPEFTVEEFKIALRRESRKYHPDVNPGDSLAEAKFKDISAAKERIYRILGLKD